VFWLLRCDANINSGANLDTLTDFVHVPEPGKGSFIYFIGRGINLAAVNVSDLCQTGVSKLTFSR
jgi:hypothetical protein